MSKTSNLLSRFANETNEPDGTARAGNPASWGRKTGSALRLLLAVTMSAGVLSTGPITRAVAAEETAPAAVHEGKSSDEIARELANPNTPLASLTFKNQIRWFDGDLPNANHQDNYTLLFQPVFPFILPETPTGGHAVLFVRPAVPLLFDQPAFDAGKMDFKPVTALGDIGFDFSCEKGLAIAPRCLSVPISPGSRILGASRPTTGECSVNHRRRLWTAASDGSVGLQESDKETA